jgi:hypothetical protein
MNNQELCELRIIAEGAAKLLGFNLETTSSEKEGLLQGLGNGLLNYLDQKGHLMTGNNIDSLNKVVEDRIIKGLDLNPHDLNNHLLRELSLIISSLQMEVTQIAHTEPKQTHISSNITTNGPVSCGSKPATVLQRLQKTSYPKTDTAWKFGYSKSTVTFSASKPKKAYSNKNLVVLKTTSKDQPVLQASTSLKKGILPDSDSPK